MIGFPYRLRELHRLRPAARPRLACYFIGACLSVHHCIGLLLTSALDIVSVNAERELQGRTPSVRASQHLATLH